PHAAPTSFGDTNHQPSTIILEEPDGSSPPNPPTGDIISMEAHRVRRSEPKGTRLAEDWQPSAADCDFCAGYGFHPSEVAEEFRDYCLAKPGAGARKTNGSRTFHNWIRRKAEQSGGFHARGGLGGNGSSRDGILAALDRVHIGRRSQGMD